MRSCFNLQTSVSIDSYTAQTYLEAAFVAILSKNQGASSVAEWVAAYFLKDQSVDTNCSPKEA